MARTATLVVLGGALFLTAATLAGMAVAQGPGPGGPPPGAEFEHRGPGGHRGFGGPGSEEHGFGEHGFGRGAQFGFFNPGRGIDRIFERLDRNYDGVIEMAEFKSVVEHRFDQLDPAKKGVITAADLKQRILDRAPGGPRGEGRGPGRDAFADRFVGRIMEHFGKPADGQITKGEYVDSYMTVFKYINRSGDGKITRKEVQDYFNVMRQMAPILRG